MYNNKTGTGHDWNLKLNTYSKIGAKQLQIRYLILYAGSAHTACIITVHNGSYAGCLNFTRIYIIM